MNSVTTKLTIAFLLVGILGAGLVALISTYQTRAEFERFIESQNTEQLSERVAQSYRDNDGWNPDAFAAEDFGRPGSFFIVDTEGKVAVGPQDREVVPQNFEVTLPISVDEEQVGTLYLRREPNEEALRAISGRSERRFVRNVVVASLSSALIASGVALGLGIFLSRQLTRPIHTLTSATQRVASGGLGEQVAIDANDELGRLASAFNKMSADLAEASQKRRQMTADIAHDLRTPLTILSGYMQGLQDGTVQASPRLINVMHEEVEHLGRLVSDLRTLSLADAGELPLNRRAVDPRALLERTGLAYVVQAEQQGVGLRVDSPEVLPSVDVDSDRMTQVLNNLVSNALRHTSQGEIVLRASAENGQVDLQVCDTGQGIAPEALPHIFDRFYRVDQSRQRQANGTLSSGLGLAIAKAIVNAHGGEIGVASKTRDSDPAQPGTTFTITLPASA